MFTICFFLFLKVCLTVPGFDFGDNKALKYKTKDNGLAEINIDVGFL